jgi:hypothetical protein
VIQGELTVISSRFVESIVVQCVKPVRLGIHAEEEESCTVTGAKRRSIHRYGCIEESYAVTSAERVFHRYGCEEQGYFQGLPRHCGGELRIM